MQERAGGLEAWVGVDLDQPSLHGFIDHDVISEKLEAVDFILYV